MGKKKKLAPMRPKTIAKSSDRSHEIFLQAKSCKAFSLSNGFVGEDCPPRFAETDLLDFRSARLKDHGEGKYRVYVHMNLWYELMV